MMEVALGRRERYYREDDEDEEASKKPPFTHSSSSSSSSCWVEAPPPPVEREHMFDKVVTPSDVGKLNRLVIPKQYAEKYFPLDHSNGDKGLLLCFEEGGTGKPWRFRYSYWNSSQSYVMTKGWSRFVKEKKLDAGDTVSFARGIGDGGRGRLFIDWRRRPSEPHRSPLPPPNPMMPLRSVVVPWGGAVPFPPSASGTIYGGSSSGGRGQYLYFRSPVPPPQFRHQSGGGGNGTVGLPAVLDSVPVVRGRAEPKRVRLFGVNLECWAPEENLNHPKPPPPPLQRRMAPPSSVFESSVELDLRFKGKQEE